MEIAGEKPRDGRFSLIVTALFVAVCLPTALHHAMWHDELESWLVVRANPTVVGLLAALKYGGHPRLWYFLLWGLRKWTNNPAWMQVMHVAIAAAGVYLAARWAPFTRLQRVLLAFGYFSLYEYGVISRNYGLGMVLVFALCILWQKRRHKPLLAALMLVLMANVNVYTFMIALAFAAAVVLQFCFDAGFRGALLQRRLQLGAAIALVLAGMALSAKLMIPPPDSPFAAPWNFLPPANTMPPHASALTILKTAIFNAGATLGTIWRAYVPIPKPTVINPIIQRPTVHYWNFWNTNILQGRFVYFRPVFSLLLVAWVLRLLRKQKWVMLFYLIGTAGILLSFYAKFFGSLRHIGSEYVLLLACLWLAADSINAGAARSRFFTLILAVQAMVGFYACAIDWIVPFSAIRQVAVFLREQHLDHQPIIACDTNSAPMCLWLDRPIIMGDSNFRLGMYTVWNIRRKEYGDRPAALKYARELACRTRQQVILVVSTAPLEQVADPGVRELVHFNRTIEPTESFWVYALSPPH